MNEGLKSAKWGEVIYYNWHLAEVVWYITNERVLIIEPVEDGGKDLCPHCSKPIPTIHYEVEGCQNYLDRVKRVNTL